MSLSQKFANFRKQFARVGRDLRELRSEAEPRRSNRWNTIGRTRCRLAEILTTYVRSIQGSDGAPRYRDVQVLPANIKAMRLVGKARLWEDAHSWEAMATFPDGGIAKTLYSFDTMTACVRAGQVQPIDKDGEVGV